MTLKDDMAADRSVFFDPNEFGVEATYTPKGGSSTTVHVLLDEEPGVSEGDIFRVRNAGLQITADSADVPNLGPGDTFAINGTTYEVHGQPPSPDEGGMVRFPVVEA